MKLSYIKEVLLREETSWKFWGIESLAQLMYSGETGQRHQNSSWRQAIKWLQHADTWLLTSHGSVSRGQSSSLSASHLFLLPLLLNSDCLPNAPWSTCTLFKQNDARFCSVATRLELFPSRLHSVNWAVLEGSVIYSMESFCANTAGWGKETQLNLSNTWNAEFMFWKTPVSQCP